MARLDSPKRRMLSQADFEAYPVWVWDDDTEHVVPISEAEPSLDDYNTLFIKARFETDGHSFDGYLIGGPTYYAFALFVAGHKFVMNFNLPDRIEKHLIDIAALLKVAPFKLFPLRYTSEVRFKGGGRIAGSLTP